MKAHDVRRMATCLACGELGFARIEDDDELPPLLRYDAPGYPGALYHPACLTRSVLLSLPVEELKKVRLCDVSRATMRALLARVG